MPTWFIYVRTLHIVSGMIALVVAPAAMLTIKGGPTHRRWGKVYFWMMAALAITAALMTVYRPVLFLALVAVFSFYFAFRGYRSVARKNQPPRAMDWVAALTALAGSVGLIVLGIYRHGSGFLPAPAVSLAFGVIGATISAIDVRRFLKPPRDLQTWWYSHMGGMLGSYIATVTAFSAVNFHFLPIVVRWLWPSVIGIPAILIWIGYYQAIRAPTTTARVAVIEVYGANDIRIRDDRSSQTLAEPREKNDASPCIWEKSHGRISNLVVD